jgi:hypothetical protein
VVIGSGADGSHQLTSTVNGSVVLGANSDKPSIAIARGSQGLAGSVAIGEDAAASKLRSLALGHWTKADANDSVVIGSGADRSRQLTSTVNGSVVLGAGSDKPSIVISPGAADRAGSVAIGADELTLTGGRFRSLPDDANFVALDRSGRFFLSDEVKNQVQQAKDSANNASRSEQNASRSEQNASRSEQNASRSESNAASSETRATTQAGLAAGSAGAAAGSATAASEAATAALGAAGAAVVAAAGSGVAADVSAALAGTNADATKKLKEAAERAANRLTFGPRTKSNGTNALVIGIGISETQPLTNSTDNSVALGAHSTLPSIVISPGSQGQAGSVAIGQGSTAPVERSLAIGPWTNANADESVVIGSGVSDAAGQQLTNVVANSVALGARSTLPSIVIWPGHGAGAGSVAIGHGTDASVAQTVVIGSGAGTAPSDKLSAPDNGAVVLGAASNKPSILISAGWKDRAGGVAIGQDATVRAPRSLAIGPWTNANADESVVIGSGAGVGPGQQLTNVVANSVALGAHSTRPSIVISPSVGNDTPGAVSIHTDLLPEKNDAHLLGNDRNRWKRIYLTEGIEVGAAKGTISYDTESSRLKLNDVSVESLAITGPLRTANPNDAKFVALDARGNFILTDLLGDNHRLLNEIEKLSRRVESLEELSRRIESLEVENDILKDKLNTLFRYDLSWEERTLATPKNSPTYDRRNTSIFHGLFLAVSESYVTISFVEEQENGSASGIVVRCKLRRFDFQYISTLSTWTLPSRITAGAAYDYAQDSRPIAADGAGRIYELDRKHGVITVFPDPRSFDRNLVVGGDGADTNLGSWLIRDQQGRLLENLGGIAVDRAGQNVYVTFSTATSGGVMKYRSDGTFLHSWSTQSLEVNRSTFAGKPRGIAVDDVDMVYVAEEALHRVQKFRSDGTFEHLWGAGYPNQPDITFADFQGGPIGVAVDGMRCIYVTDRDDTLIKKLNLGGDQGLLATWDAAGLSFGSRAEGLAVDRVGNVYLPSRQPYLFYQGKPTLRPREPAEEPFKC